jgi:hypothetical protein
MDRKPEPTNYHELAIAEVIDAKAPGTDDESMVAEVLVSMPFDMSIADTQFLFNYAFWRQAQPCKKQPTGGILETLKQTG